MPQEGLLIRITGIVAGPIFGIVQHDLFHRGAQALRAMGEQHIGDVIEGIKRLTPRKGQAGADLQNAETIVDKGGQGGWRLVIG